MHGKIKIKTRGVEMYKGKMFLIFYCATYDTLNKTMLYLCGFVIGCDVYIAYDNILAQKKAYKLLTIRMALARYIWM